MSAPSNPSHRSYILLAALSCALSVAAFAHYFRNGQFLLYGDAEAHLNIARRIVDSLTPGLKQMGTVWLPLPHLLMVPFVWSDAGWRSGWAGSIPSMLAFVAGALGIFRLVRSLASETAAWLAAAVYALNPNLLYLQSTAMTEPLFLAAMIWMAAGLVEAGLCFRRLDPEAAKWPLIGCGMASFAGSLTRYEGWFVSFCAGLVALRLYFWLDASQRARLRNAFLVTGFLMAVAPVGWLAYNWSTYGNPLEFATGPYSARAIEERTTRPGDPHHPGYHSPAVATLYFVKSAKMNLAAGPAEGALVWIALLGAVAALCFQPRRRIALLLWAVVPFYALAMAYGGIPIFIPPWWPFSYYNARYGVELLPAVAVFCALLFDTIGEIKYRPRVERGMISVAVLLLAWSYVSVWRASPISLREAVANGSVKVEVETRMAEALEPLARGSRLLMYTGTHGGALRRAGIPLEQTVNENNYLYWESALAGPAEAADLIVATDGDPVAEAVRKRPEGLEKIGEVVVSGQPAMTIYRSHRRPAGR